MNPHSLISALGFFEETTVLFVHETSEIWCGPNKQPPVLDPWVSLFLWTLVQFANTEYANRRYASLGICESTAACQLLTLRHRSQVFIDLTCIATWSLACCFTCSWYWAASVHRTVWFEVRSKNSGVASQHEGPISFVTPNAGLSSQWFGLILLQTQWKCGIFQNSQLKQWKTPVPVGHLTSIKAPRNELLWS